MTLSVISPACNLSPMANPLLDRFNRVFDHIDATSDFVVDDVREMAGEVVEVVRRASKEAEFEGMDELVRRLSDIPSRAIEGLGDTRDQEGVDEATALGWTANLAKELADLFEDFANYRSGSEMNRFNERWRYRFLAIHERAVGKLEAAVTRRDLAKQVRELQMELGHTEEETKAALTRLNETQSRYNDVLMKAENAAGDIATKQFEENFVHLEESEARIANRFRSATIAGIGVAIVYATFWAAGLWRTPGEPVADASRWVEFASHLTIVAGIGALTAYLGRQAGQHRRTANWAQSVAVQLKSFPALATLGSAAVEDALYVALANRVLAAPPEKGVEPDNTGVTSAQVMDIVLAAMKKTP